MTPAVAPVMPVPSEGEGKSRPYVRQHRQGVHKDQIMFEWTRKKTLESDSMNQQHFFLSGARRKTAAAAVAALAAAPAAAAAAAAASSGNIDSSAL